MYAALALLAGANGVQGEKVLMKISKKTTVNDANTDHAQYPF